MKIVNLIKTFSTLFGFIISLFFFGCSSEKKQGAVPPPEVKYEKLPEIKWDFARTDLHLAAACKEAETFFKGKSYKNPADQKAFLASPLWNNAYKKYFEADMLGFVPFCEPYFIEHPAELESLPAGKKDTFNTIVKEILGSFVSHPKLQVLADSIAKTYPAGYDFEKKLKPLLQRFKLLYPDFSVPKVRTVMKAYNPREDWVNQYTYDRYFITKEYIFITLEYFSGNGFRITHPEIPLYLRNRRHPENMPCAIAGGLADFYRPAMTQKNLPALIDLMIYDGIRYYAMDVLLPEAADSSKFMTTRFQLETAEKLAPYIYKALIPHFFSQNFKQFDFALSDGPNTSLPKIGLDASNKGLLPPRLGAWVGWQMVRNYMKSHPEVTFKELLTTRNYRKIFQESGYKPEVPK